MLKLQSKVGPKGQVVIPKGIRDHFNIFPGEAVYFRTENDEITLETRSGEAVLEVFFNEVKAKKQEPKHINWDKEYYERFGG